MMPNHRPKVLVLNGWVGYAPFEKRIRALRGHCSALSVLGIGRDLELGDQVTANFDPIGNIESGNYLRRVPVYLGALRKARRAAREVDIVYALGFEMGALASAATLGLPCPPALVYEIHDIRNAVLGTGISARILRAVERAVTRRVSLLVVTSQSYLERYYFPQLGANGSCSLVIENKLIGSELPVRSQISPNRAGRRRGDPIIVGYFGSIRCSVAWRLVTTWVEQSKGRVRCIVRGAPRGIPSFYDDIARIEGLTYEGTYRDPEDLAQLYTNVDIVWAAGNQQKASYAWSRVCRYYNACYFKRPLIVADGTDDGLAVEALGIGRAIDLNEIELARRLLDTIDDADLHDWGAALDRLPDSACTYAGENRELFRRLLGEGAQ